MWALSQSIKITIILIIITVLKPRVVGSDDGFPAKHRPVNQAEWDLRGEGGIIKSVNIGVDVHIGVDLGIDAYVDIGVDIEMLLILVLILMLVLMLVLTLRSINQQSELKGKLSGYESNHMILYWYDNDIAWSAYR